MIFFKTFAITATLLNAILVLYFATKGTTMSVVNLELSAIGSLLILTATYFGYKKMIENRVSEVQPEVEESKADEAQKIESEDEKEEREEEEARIEKPSTVSAVTGSYKGYLFPLRLIAYGVFATSFVYLSSSGSLEIASFFAGLAIAPASVLLTMFWLKKTQNEIQ